MKRPFYGWVTLGAIFFIYASGTIGVSTLPLINEQIKERFGWTHEQITLAPSMLFLMMALMSPLAGLLLEILNPKKILLIGGSCFILALLLYSQVNNLFMFMAVYVIYSIGSVCTGIIPGIYLISKWFVKHRGIATGIFTVGSSFGGVIFPKIAAALLIVTGSWQQTGLLLAGVTALFALIPWFFVVNYPEELGLHPDGELAAEDAPQVQQTPRRSVREIFGSIFGEHLKMLFQSFTFYMILLITAAVWFCVTPMVQHLSYHMKDLNVDISTRATILSTLFFCSIIGKLFFGWVSEYGDKKIILFIATLCMAGGSGLVRLTTTGLFPIETLLFVAAVVYGIGFSGSFTMIQLLVAEEYSAHKVFGSILGFVAMFDSLAGVTGIFILGKMRTVLGNYDIAFFMLTLVGLIAGIGVLTLKFRKSFIQQPV